MKVSGTTVTPSVANVGDAVVNVTAAYVLYQNGSAACGGSLDEPVTLVVGAVQDIDVPGDCSLSTGVTYIAKAVTAKGTEAAYTFTKQ